MKELAFINARLTEAETFSVTIIYICAQILQSKHQGDKNPPRHPGERTSCCWLTPLEMPRIRICFQELTVPIHHSFLSPLVWPIFFLKNLDTLHILEFSVYLVKYDPCLVRSISFFCHFASVLHHSGFKMWLKCKLSFLIQRVLKGNSYINSLEIAAILSISRSFSEAQNELHSDWQAVLWSKKSCSLDILWQMY